MTSDASDDDGADPTDAFALLGNETRMGIVRELSEAGAVGPDGDAVAYQRLRERAGVADSGRFNYHLDQLRDQFVEKTDGGYVLNYAGQEVVSALYAGTYTGDHAASGTHPCPICDAEAEVTYEDGYLSIECPNDHPVRTTFPPGAAADRSLDELVSASLLTTRQEVELFLEGICARCYGPLDDPTVAADRIPIGPGDPVETHLLTWTCPRCDADHTATPGIAAFRHPEVLGFHYERGADPLGEGLLAHEWAMPGGATVVSEDPYRFRVGVEIDGDRLDVVVDGDGEVVRTERSDQD